MELDLHLFETHTFLDGVLTIQVTAFDFAQTRAVGGVNLRVFDDPVEGRHLGMRWLHVIDAYQRRGVASAILDEAVGIARSLACEDIEFCVWKDNIPALALYRKHDATFTDPEPLGIELHGSISVPSVSSVVKQAS